MTEQRDAERSYTREELYELVWLKPMTELAKELTPSIWADVVEYPTGSKARNGQKGSCHEETEVVQFRVQASSC